MLRHYVSCGTAPRLSRCMGKDIELAILFADVVGSTRLYELMGDLRARDMVAICIDVMRTATEQNQGTVIKTMGDEVMSTFADADQALNAAAQMQQQISRHSQLKVEGQPVALRIGCHLDRSCWRTGMCSVPLCTRPIA